MYIDIKVRNGPNNGWSLELIFYAIKYCKKHGTFFCYHLYLECLIVANDLTQHFYFTLFLMINHDSRTIIADRKQEKWPAKCPIFYQSGIQSPSDICQHSRQPFILKRNIQNYSSISFWVSFCIFCTNLVNFVSINC